MKSWFDYITILVLLAIVACLGWWFCYEHYGYGLEGYMITELMVEVQERAGCKTDGLAGKEMIAKVNPIVKAEKEDYHDKMAAPYFTAAMYEGADK